MTKKDLTPRTLIAEIRASGWTRQAAGAVLGLLFGIFSGLMGSVLTATAWFTGPEWHGVFVQRDGTVLLFLTIPLLLFGAHCLDLMDRQDSVLRRSQQ